MTNLGLGLAYKFALVRSIAFDDLRIQPYAKPAAR